jgi:hypothetical protein
MANPKSSRRRAKLSVDRTRQNEAMIGQFSRPDRVQSEQRDWQWIRRAAAARKLTT